VEVEAGQDEPLKEVYPFFEVPSAIRMADGFVHPPPTNSQSRALHSELHAENCHN
jgi:hypothetical protein